MRVTIHQPSYWPWLGLLDKIAKSETLIVLDDVAANKASTQYRNQFYCGGIAKYVSLPVNYQKGIQLNRLEFKNNSWRDDHLNKLKNYYMKAPFFNEIFEAIQPMYVNNENETPFNFILNTMKLSFELLGINTKVLLSSSFESTSFKGDLVIDLCDRSLSLIHI